MASCSPHERSDVRDLARPACRCCRERASFREWGRSCAPHAAELPRRAGPGRSGLGRACSKSRQASCRRPVNAHEAEGRRLARFEAFGHTSGPMAPRPATVNPEYPLTLDLRRRH
ncbi:transglutaminase family protein [Bradyrhizobium sp.]|uniref:transglutaminase family protein n=1 Tax=Bradyrhizobium sp. TaxID=376 RepID=UPI00345DB57B